MFILPTHKFSAITESAQHHPEGYKSHPQLSEENSTIRGHCSPHLHFSQHLS
ncbi:hypothetical protein L218DRAFT_961534 [Marasmius fiardii PR-910]|nr:hypothetical protein L218DRAFT_961534 [Marasmius fiardii PR-910]